MVRSAISPAPESIPTWYALGPRRTKSPRDLPLIAVCRAGGRSAQATVILRKAGIERVANLAGGACCAGALCTSSSKGERD